MKYKSKEKIMKDIKDITLDDFVFKDEMESVERNFIAKHILDGSYNEELDYFLKDESFLKEFDKIFEDYNANLSKKKAREKVQYVYETLCNPERGYILKTLIYKHTLKLLIKNMAKYTSKEWAKKLEPQLKNMD